MKSKKLFVLVFAVLSALIILAILFFLHKSHFFVVGKEANLQSYLEMPLENNYLPNEGYIPDVKTAAKIGSAIIDELCEEDGMLGLGFVDVEYDENNRLWKVNKTYLFHRGAFVIIEQDTGEIVKALLNQ